MQEIPVDTHAMFGLLYVQIHAITYVVRDGSSFRYYLWEFRKTRYKDRFAFIYLSRLYGWQLTHNCTDSCCHLAMKSRDIRIFIFYCNIFIDIYYSFQCKLHFTYNVIVVLLGKAYNTHIAKWGNQFRLFSNYWGKITDKEKTAPMSHGTLECRHWPEALQTAPNEETCNNPVQAAYYNNLWL